MVWDWASRCRDMAETPALQGRAIQAAVRWLKGQYALEFCQIPQRRSAPEGPRKVRGGGGVSRRDAARYLRPRSSVRRAERDRAAESELRAHLCVALRRIGADGCRADDRYRADRTP